MLDEKDVLIIDEIERERGYVKGDFRIAVEIFWFTMKYFMTRPEMPPITIKNFGSFRVRYGVLIRLIHEEIETIQKSYGTRPKDRLGKLLRVRRGLIESGYATKMYYYHKMFRKGVHPNDAAAYDDYLKICKDLEALDKSRGERFRRYKPTKDGAPYYKLKIVKNGSKGVGGGESGIGEV